VERRIAIENELRAAISAKSIVPFYQPLVAFAGERIIGFEALARWKSDKFGWVPPDQFITIAEELGLISELGDQLSRQIARAVNLSLSSRAKTSRRFSSRCSSTPCPSK
jgi:sensor c-di-GMP phosphodiesterase-like protein